MRGRTVGAALGLVIGCGTEYPAREFDCAAIADAYATKCGDFLGISIETAACQVVHDEQNGPLAASIDLAAGVCEEAAMDGSCIATFVCLDDEHGLSALDRDVKFGGSAEIGGVQHVLDGFGWAWIGTTKGGNAGDFEVVFEAEDRAWYFRLDSFVERARTEPFAVDALRPIKLENTFDNVEMASGTVIVDAFALDGAFEVEVSGTDPATGDSVMLFFSGSFAAE